MRFSEDVIERDKNCKIESMSGDVTLYNCTGSVDTMSGDVEVHNYTGEISTMSGDVYFTNGNSGQINTMSGNVHLTDSKVDKIETMSGNIILFNSEINYVETMSGKVVLHNSSIKEYYGYKFSGEGSIEHLVTPILSKDKNTSFNLFNPSTWFKYTTENVTYCKNICINNGVVETSSQVPKEIYVPEEIKIKKITTDRVVVSKYPIEVTGGGSLRIIGDNE